MQRNFKWIMLALFLPTQFSTADISEPSYKTSPSLGLIDEWQVRKNPAPLGQNLSALAFGPTWTSHLKGEDFLYGFSYTNLRLVHPHAEIRIRASIAFSENQKTILTSSSLGASYIVSPKEFSPILGSELGLALIKQPEVNSKLGFSTALFAGIRAFRHSHNQLELSTRLEFYSKREDKAYPRSQSIQLSLLL